MVPSLSSSMDWQWWQRGGVVVLVMVLQVHSLLALHAHLTLAWPWFPMGWGLGVGDPSLQIAFFSDHLNYNNAK